MGVRAKPERGLDKRDNSDGTGRETKFFAPIPHPLPWVPLHTARRILGHCLLTTDDLCGKCARGPASCAEFYPECVTRVMAIACMFVCNVRSQRRKNG